MGKITVIFLAAVLLALSWTGCKKNPSGPAPVVPSKFLYMTVNNPSAGDLSTMDSAGNSKSVILPGADPFSAGNISSNNKAVYTDGFLSYIGDLHYMNADGTGNTKITYSVDVFEANINPAGTKVALVRYTGLYYDIWTCGTDGTGMTNITNSTSNNYYCPVFSPDGTKILYSMDFSTLHVMNADGTNDILIGPVATTMTAESGSFSPDASKIALTGYDSIAGRGGVWIMNANGTNLAQIVTPDGWTGRVIWTKENVLIFDMQLSGFKADIYSVKPDGSALTDLTNTPLKDEYLDYMPWW